MMTEKFMQVWPVFLDHVFGFVYEWLWKAFCVFLGMILMNLYIPGALEFIQPFKSQWMATIILASAILTMIQQTIEPILTRFLFTKPQAPKADPAQ